MMDQKVKGAARGKKPAVAARVTAPTGGSSGHIIMESCGMVSGKVAPTAAGNSMPAFRVARIGG